MRENKTCPNTGWQQMPTDELDQILQAELEKEHPNEEVVLPILRELEEREKDIPIENTPEVLEVLEKLSKHNTSSKQSIHKRRWLAGIAAAAAVVCIVIISMSPTVRAESLFDILVRWTNSIFEFIDVKYKESSIKVCEYLAESEWDLNWGSGSSSIMGISYNEFEKSIKMWYSLTMTPKGETYASKIFIMLFSMCNNVFTTYKLYGNFSNFLFSNFLYSYDIYFT